MASDPQTWTELKTVLETWIIRDDEVDRIPIYIAFAERRFNREVFHPDRLVIATLSATTETVALPTDFSAARAAWLDTSPKSILEQVTLGDLRYFHPESEAGIPQKFAISGGNMYLGPAPAGTSSIKVEYYQTIPALGASQATNWLLTDHPDIYLYASLVEAFAFSRDETRAAVWEVKTQAKIREVNKAGSRFAFGTPLRARSSSVA